MYIHTRTGGKGIQKYAVLCQPHSSCRQGGVVVVVVVVIGQDILVLPTLLSTSHCAHKQFHCLFFFFFFSTSFFFFCSSSLQISFPQNQPNPKTATFFHHILSNFTQPKASILSRIILLLLKKTCVSCIFCLLFFLILTYRRMLLRKLAAQFVVWFLSTFFILFTIQHKKRTLGLLPSFPYISGLKK